MRNLLIMVISCLCISLVIVSSSGAQNLLNNPESVVYDAARLRYLVSNAGNGKIIAMTAQGVQSQYQSDQSGIRGLHIMGDTLYAATNSGLAGYRLADAVRLFTLTIPGMNFLNDIASDDGGNLYVTDTGAGKIYKVQPAPGTFSTLAQNIPSVNGILFDRDNNRLIIVRYQANSPIQAVHPASGAVTTIVNTSYSNLDGLARDKQGRIYVTSAAGNTVYRYDAAFSSPAEVFSTGHSAPADLYFNPLTDTLAVPNFNAHTVDFIPIPVVYSAENWVTNTLDGGAGSLRHALEYTNSHSGADTIFFDIPASDANYDAARGVWTIAPQTPLPEIENEATVIDGSSQKRNQGDTNPGGLQIMISGAAHTGDGLVITCGKNQLIALIINACSKSGIKITGTSARKNTVTGCFIGTDDNGLLARPNHNGIEVTGGAKSNEIGQAGGRNVIAGNANYGVLISGTGTDSNAVRGNLIGTDRTSHNALANNYGGVTITSGAQYNVIGGDVVGEANVISGANSVGMDMQGGNGVYLKGAFRNKVIGNMIGVNVNGSVALPNITAGICINAGGYNLIGGSEVRQGNLVGCNYYGIWIRNSRKNTVVGNAVGTDFKGVRDLGQYRHGILLNEGSDYNVIGPGNIVAFNKNDGVFAEHDSTLFNTITQNSITQNSGKGIYLVNGANALLAPPIIEEASVDRVSGRAGPLQTVEIFADDDGQGAHYLGIASTKADGKFICRYNATTGRITATATDAEGNTSEFSQPSVPVQVLVQTSTLPCDFALRQNYPNPCNPETIIPFSLPRSVHVRLALFNVTGQKVCDLVDEVREAGTHRIKLDARHLPAGLYACLMRAEGFSAVRKIMVIK